MEGPSQYTITCEHDLVDLPRWTGFEAMHLKNVEDPSIILAYNLFTNVVDRFDQLIAKHNTECREKRVPMNIFTFLFDDSILIAFSLYHHIIVDGPRVTLR